MKNTKKIKSYTLSHAAPSVKEFIQLRADIGWGEINSQLARQSLEHSLFHVTIRQGEQLIAMGRVLGDGAMYFHIQDVIVTKPFQKRGLGHLLMVEIEAYLEKQAKSGATIGLFAAKGKEDFYHRYQYLARPNASLGKGMCRFA